MGGKGFGVGGRGGSSSCLPLKLLSVSGFTSSAENLRAIRTSPTGLQVAVGSSQLKITQLLSICTSVSHSVIDESHVHLTVEPRNIATQRQIRRPLEAIRNSLV